MTSADGIEPAGGDRSAEPVGDAAEVPVEEAATGEEVTVDPDPDPDPAPAPAPAATADLPGALRRKAGVEYRPV